MSSISWAGAVSGDWATGANWSGGVAPGANDDVKIALSGNFTVDITTPVSAKTLTLNNPGATVLDTGSLTLTGALTLTAGTFNLGTGGAIVGGTIVDSSSHLFCAGGTLDGVTYQGQLNLLSGGQSVTIANGITLSGVGGVGQANVNASSATINFQGTQTFDNAQVSLGNSVINVLDPNDVGGVLTIGANTVIGSFNVTGNSISDAGGAADGIVNMGQIQVGAGTITVNGNSFTNVGSVDVQNAPSAHLIFNSSTFTNNGTVNAAGGGMLQLLDTSFINNGTISISGTTQLTIGKSGSSWTNANGAITMSGGVLLLNGNFTTANLGTITGSGGTLQILGNLDNTGATLSTGTGTAFSALTVKGSIENGLVVGPTAAGLVLAGGTLDGVIFQGNLDLSANGATGTILHGITLSGAGGVGKSTIALTGSGSELFVDGNATLDNATINIAGTLATTDQAGTGAVLTICSQATIVETGTTASIIGASNAGDGIVLQGNLTVNASQGQVLNIQTPSLTSTGTITLGSFVTVNLANGMPGGTVVTLNGGSFTVGNGSTVRGGTIVDGGSRFLLPNAATLDGITYQGVLDLTGPNDNPNIINGITLSGVGGVGKAIINFSGTGTLDLSGNETLDNATINFGTNQNGVSDIFANDPQSHGAILTLGSNLLIQQTGNRALLASSGLNTDGIVNQGTINAGLSTGTLAIDPANFTNAGAINVSNGESVDIDATNFTNAAAGTVTVTTGATVSIDGTGAWSNAGTISETNATLNLGGNFTTAAIGTIARSGGTINITGKLDNTGATLAFGAGTTLGAVNLSGTIKNGTIQSTANGFTGSANFGGGTLDGVTYQGTLDMTATQGSLTIINGIALSGAGGVGAATINITGVGASITGKGNETFDNATINLGTSGNGTAVLFAYDPFATGTVLTLGPNLVIQQAGTHAQLNGSDINNDGFINQGTINGGVSGGTLTLIAQVNGVGGKFTNSGAINASNGDSVEVGATTFANTATGTVNVTTGVTFTIDGAGSWSNAGLLSETGGTLVLGGNFTTANLGTVTRSGGIVRISGVLDNTGATIAFGTGSTLGAVALTGTIKNGTIQDGGNGLAPSGAAILDGVNYQGVLDMSATQSALTVVNGITFSSSGGTGPGVINLTGTGSVLNGKGPETFDNATLNFGTSGNGIAIFYASDSQGKGTTVLTLGPNLVVQQTGLKAEFEGQDIGADGFINQGVINAGVSGGSLTVFQRQFNVGGAFTNSGAINVSNNEMVEIGATTFTNGGTVTVTTGATLSIDGTGSWSNSGSITETGATLTLGGNFATASLNTISRSGGTVNLSGTINNANTTLNLGAGSALGAVNFTGTINGGIVHDGGGGLLCNSGTLNGATYQGTLDLSAFQATLNITNGITLTDATGNNPGTINLTGFSASIDAKGNDTLDNATINIGAANTSTIVNYGSLQAGNTLTLGANLLIQQTGAFAAISGTGGVNDGVVNNGVINASASGGSFIINPVKFTNAGTLIAGAAGEVVDLRSTNFTNLSGGTLTGGIFQTSAGGVIQLANNVTVTTLQTDVTENGATSAIRSLVTGTNTQRNIDTTLTGIGASGALRLLGGHNLTTATTFSIAGTLQLAASTFTTGAVIEAATGQIVGNGTIASAITDNGLIEAKSGTLKLTGALSGTGSLQIDANATLELGAAFADQLGVSFAGSNGKLMIDTPSSYSGVITGFSATEAINLKSTVATSATLNGTTMTVMLSGGGTQTYTLAAPLPGTELGVASDGNGGTLITDFQDNLASGQVASVAGGNNTPTTIDFGNARVGSTLTEALAVTNTATTPAEGLDASIAGTAGSVGASGAISLLGASQTDQSSLNVTLDSSAAGVRSGSVTVGLSSDGTSNGRGVTALPNQTINVQATLFRLANGVVLPVTSSMIVHVGDTVNEALSVTNNVANDGFSEKLDVSVMGASAGLSANGAIQLLDAGATDLSSMSVGISTATAGTVSGTVQLLLKSDGAGTSGFSAMSLGVSNVNIMLQVDNFAAASFMSLAGGTLTQTGPHSYTLDLGSVMEGSSPLSATFGVKNSATGLADQLSGDFSDSGASGFNVTGLGAFSGLSAGQSDQNLQTTLSTGQAGNFSDTLTLHGSGSNASGYSGTLADTTLTITGKVLNVAEGTVDTTVPIDFGNHHVGDVVTQSVSVTNSAPTATPSAALDGDFAAAPAGFTASGAVSMLAAGATDATHLKLGLSTATEGAKNGTATLDLLSDDGTNEVALPSETIDLSGRVYAYAAPTLNSHVLDLGVGRVGGLLNGSVKLSDGSSADAFQESLDYDAGTAPAGYAVTGTTSGTIASGNSASIGVSFTGTTAGNFSNAVLSLGLTSTGAGTSGLADTALAAQSVTLDAKVYALAAAQLGASSINFGNIHVGGTATKTLQITNSGTGALVDMLTGGFATVSGAFSATGANMLPAVAAGSSGSLSIKFSSNAEGNCTGNATLSLHSHDSDLTDLKITTGPVALKGKAYAYAAPVLTGKTSINFGSVRVGGTVSSSQLKVADGSAMDSFQEALTYSLGVLPTGFKVTGTVSGTIGSGESESLLLSMSTLVAGNYSNRQVSLSLTSTGAKTSGLGNTALASRTLTFSGKVYAQAVAKLDAMTIDFGTVHVGAVVAGKKLGIFNIATGALSDVLIGGFSSVTGGFTGSGNLGAAGVASGASGTLTFQMNTATAGAFTGTASLALGSHDADLANVGVTVGGVTLKGTVDNYAVTAFKKDGGNGTLIKQGTNYRLNLGTVTQGAAALSTTISAVNAVNGVADRLAGSFTSKASAAVFSLSGFASFSGLNAGQSTAGMKITLSTAKTGTFTETITLSGRGSNSSGYNAAVAPVTLTVTGTVAAPAATSHPVASQDAIAEGNTLLAKDELDLSDVSFGPSTVMNYNANANHKGGTLSINNGSHAAKVLLFGQFVAADFHAASDGVAGTTVTYVPMDTATTPLAVHH
jgi:hypothetical protein